nr:SGNH/GDSL hydrolase family protein [uncultured Acetatifactor sp.]
MKNDKPSQDSQQLYKIPDLDIIDLEQEHAADGSAQDSRQGDGTDEEDGIRTKKRTPLSYLNLHVVLLVVFLLFVAGLIYKIANFGVPINLDEIFADGPGEYSDTFDTFVPLLDADNNPVFKDYSQGSLILAFGNAPFADDRDSKDNLVNLMRDKTGANIVNCSISGSYLAAQEAELNAETNPWDIFNFYWLCHIAAQDEPVCEQYLKGLEILGDSAPPEARDVYDFLTSVDLNEVDAVVVMYDASDYLAGHEMYNDLNATDLTQFTGNTEAGIEYLQYFYPNIRIIVMSPTYAYGLDENGNYISSDIQRYGQDVLSTYVIKQYASCASRSVTFVDNLYGTITEDNADEYLTDHLHLNVKGRKKVAERFDHALNYFKDAVSDSPE